MSTALPPRNGAGFSHNWTSPFHKTLPVPPPSHAGAPADCPQELHRLLFNPLGLYDLRRRIGIFENDPAMWNTYPRRWLSADLAWFVSGASEDNQHHPGASDGFFPEFFALRDSLPSKSVGGETGPNARKGFEEAIRKLLFDVVRSLS
jgi:hypothetical protein